jgi:hypothetical protein
MPRDDQGRMAFVLWVWKVLQFTWLRKFNGTPLTEIDQAFVSAYDN